MWKFISIGCSILIYLVDFGLRFLPGLFILFCPFDLALGKGELRLLARPMIEWKCEEGREDIPYTA